MSSFNPYNDDVMSAGDIENVTNNASDDELTPAQLAYIEAAVQEKLERDTKANVDATRTRDTAGKFTPANAPDAGAREYTYEETEKHDQYETALRNAEGRDLKERMYNAARATPGGPWQGAFEQRRWAEHWVTTKGPLDPQAVKDLQQAVHMAELGRDVRAVRRYKQRLQQAGA